MPKAKPTSASGPTRRMRPGLTPEARENQLISAAYDLVERRILEGTASSQETTHFLKLGSSKSRLEMEKLKIENELNKVKTEAIQSQKKMEELYINALNAMRTYSGQGGADDDDQEEDEY